MLIRREAIKAAMCAADSGSDSRYYLQALHVTAKGQIEATDGHILARVTDKFTPDPEDFPAVSGVGSPFGPPVNGGMLLPTSTAAKLIAAMPKKPTIPILQFVKIGRVDDHNYAVATDLSAPIVACLDNEQGQTFPAVDRIFDGQNDRDPAATITVCLNASLLARLAKMAKEASGDPAKGITFTIPIPKGTAGQLQPTAPVVESLKYTIETDDLTIEGAVMPLRA